MKINNPPSPPLAKGGWGGDLEGYLLRKGDEKDEGHRDCRKFSRKQ